MAATEGAGKSMIELLVSEIAQALGVPFEGGGTVREVSTDSRTIGPGSLFVALPGERFDGHDYIAKAFAAGAAACVAERKVSTGNPVWDERILVVPDSQRSLLQIAAYYRQKFSFLSVGVTGSVGKTTTKDMIAAVLSSRFATLKTLGNENNEIGLPRTVMRLMPDTQAAVFEMGMSGFGEIHDLTLCVRPDIGVITTIGVSHMLQLGSRENILKAKTEICDGMADGATLLLNGDNDLLQNYQNRRLNVVKYGIDGLDCAISAKNIREAGEDTHFSISYEGNAYPCTLPCIGRHNVLNALAAFGVGVFAGIPPQSCADALNGYQPSGMRQRMRECRGVRIVEDCYNASPDSMRAAIETLSTMACAGKKRMVLADMLELGEISQDSHRQIGVFAAQKGVDALYCYGGEARRLYEGAREAGLKDCRWFPDKETLTETLCREAVEGDILWFKGSRGMKLEEVITRFCEECKDKC
ncbi:UDP-N-acetylmuramoyl-tripeptide--D-alanyl-D-alanine ligase [Zongyangia hominis]|uniref:UDP-N-acetylmuramoyl-tripeptide--D-alanyl-D-alanine ligase n=1 Tax=Zongyangia hominis TaxID=2763677 RepID=A0A926ECY5_9FIRM|nr:UDP-N-acetylmuramoyl-tripeptide--D-alanyl-D-alanine ligase [Zongyangia hominis]MBC8570109.1 UDP-N-acetylmuramoyl-tripeptide--D-alanyl-D-alanine ligase [Zongyangia hominis]